MLLLSATLSTHITANIGGTARCRYGVAHGLILVPIIISFFPSKHHRKHLYKWRASQGDSDDDLREQQPATDAGGASAWSGAEVTPDA